MLSELVKEFGTTNWAELSSAMLSRHGIDGRSGKQCRERWRNSLDPAISKEPWTPEEEELLQDAHRRLGNRWVDIAKLLPGRTDNCVKNHFYGAARKSLRATKQDSPSSEPPPVSATTQIPSGDSVVKRGHSGFTPNHEPRPRKLKLLSPKPLPQEAWTPSQYPFFRILASPGPNSPGLTPSQFLNISEATQKAMMPMKPAEPLFAQPDTGAPWEVLTKRFTPK